MDHPDASLEVVNCRQNQITSNICDLEAVLMTVNYCLWLISAKQQNAS